MSCTLQFLTYYLSQNSFIYRLFLFGKVMSESFVDHCLIPVARCVGASTKLLENIIVDENGNSGFSFLRNNRASFSFFEIIFLLHRLFSLFAWLVARRSTGYLLRDRCIQQPRHDSNSLHQQTQTALRFGRSCLRLSAPWDQKAQPLHQKIGSCACGSWILPSLDPRLFSQANYAYIICICQGDYCGTGTAAELGRWANRA